VVSAVLKGDKQLERQLAALETKVQKRIVKQSLGRGLTVIAREARRQAPVIGGVKIKKLIGTRNKPSKKKGIHEAKVGVAVGRASKYQGDGFLSANSVHLFILGTKERFHKSGKRAGQSTGKLKPVGDNFMQKAFQQAKGDARKTILNSVRQKIQQEAAKK